MSNSNNTQPKLTAKQSQQMKELQTIERLKLPVQITDLMSYSILHDFVIINDYEQVSNKFIGIHPAAFMNINGVIYYEIAFVVCNRPRHLFSPPEYAKKLLARNKERKVTNKTKLFIPWKFDKPLSTHDSKNNLHFIYIRSTPFIYSFEVYDYIERAGNKLDLFEYMEEMLNRYNLPIPEFSDCLAGFKSGKDIKPIETYDININDIEDDD